MPCWGLLAVGWLLLPVTLAAADEVRDAPGRGGRAPAISYCPSSRCSPRERWRRTRTRGGHHGPEPARRPANRTPCCSPNSTSAGRAVARRDRRLRAQQHGGTRPGRRPVRKRGPSRRARRHWCSRAPKLTASFRLWQRLDDTLTDDSLVRRQLLEEIVARCTEAGRRLDAEAPGFDLLRALERTLPAALELRRPASGSSPRAPRPRRRRSPNCASGTPLLASLSVAGNVEQAKDRLSSPPRAWTGPGSSWTGRARRRRSGRRGRRRPGGPLRGRYRPVGLLLSLR